VSNASNYSLTNTLAEVEESIPKLGSPMRQILPFAIMGL